MNDKREAIMTAAMELFAERGFYGTPVPLIAEKAQVGSGTIYRYFKDKEALVNEVYRHLKTQMFLAIDEKMDLDQPLRAAFRTAITTWIQYAIDNEAAFAFLEAHHHKSYLDAESQALSESLHAKFTEVFIQGQKDQVLRSDAPPDVLMAVITGIIHAVVKSCWTEHFELTPELIDKIEEMAWQAIRC